MKKLSLLLFMACFAFGLSAQRTISGTVIDNAGEALIGVNITAAGTSVGTISDIDGSYTLSVPEGSTSLIYSYTGYTSQEVPLGASSVLDITLSEGLELEEIVVTGLGIKREKKALGYGVSTLGEDAISARQETDVARILRGKATGVDITQTSGMAGTGTNVIIRGYSSITGTNQPLFVVDGVPFNTDTNATNNGQGGNATASSRFLDLDPNNIAEISILKGLSATVLYGEAGRNGVVLVTTKNGNVGAETDKGFEVTVTQSISQTEVANIPDYQNTYGNGFGGNFGWFFSNWGPAFDVRGSNGISAEGTIAHPYDQPQYNEVFPEFIGANYEYKPYQTVENFFSKGLTSNTSFAIENSFGNGNAVSATYSYLTDEGFTPRLDKVANSFDGLGGSSNYLNKHNFGLGATTKLNMGLNIRATFNYTDSERRTPPTGSGFGGDGNGLFAALVFTPRSIDLNNIPYQNPLNGSNVYYRRGSPIQNPYWTLNNVNDTEVVRRFFSTMELSYDLLPDSDFGLRAMYRVGVDQYTQNSRREYNRGGPRQPDGQLSTFERLNQITDQVLNVMYDYSINEDLSLDGLVGVNLKTEKAKFFYGNSFNQFVYGLFTHQNFVEHNNFSNIRDENTLGAYATATLGYKNFFYLNLQGRNDWTSTLEAGNNTIFYPSASVSFIPTEAIEGLRNNSAINYLKLRLGYGTSAGYPNPYQTRNTLNTATNQFVSAGGATLNTNSVSNVLGNPDLLPEIHKELEGGVEARFLNNRVGIDLSVYNKVSSDLIINLDLDPATGFTNTTVNAAQITNDGIELGLNLVPIRSNNFQWDVNLNYTKNRSIVDKISEGVDQILIGNTTALGVQSGSILGNGLGNYAIPGEQYGVIQGSSFVRGQNGGLLVNSVGGYIESPDIGIIGNPNPNFTANWINNISFGGLSFGFQFSYQDGGDIYSQTIAALLARGNTVDTDVNRFIPIILPGELDDGTPNNIQTYMGNTFFDGYFGANEGSLFDGTTIRVREVSLAYTLPKSIVDSTPFGRVGITLAGENVWHNSVNTPAGVNFDPEVLSTGVGNARGFDLRTGPTARKYGVTLNATF